MTYSYTQISQYLSCPRSYRYRYLDGWKEKDTRAALLFGRAFEKALAAYLPARGSRPLLLFKEWGAYQKQDLQYSNGDDWERMLQQGVQLLERFARTTASAFANPTETCRSSSTVRLPTAMTSSPTSMR